MNVRFIAWTLLSFAAWQGASAQTGADVALRNVSVVDVRTGDVRPGQTVLVRGSSIAAIGPARAIGIPRGARVIDGDGKFLVPGLMDTHVHLFQPWAHQSPDTVAQLRWILAGGVTTVRDAVSAGLEATLANIRRLIAAGSIDGPRILISALPNENIRRRAGTDDLAQVVRRYPDLGIDFVKVRYPTRDSAMAVIHAAAGSGVPVFGHTTEPGIRPGSNFTWDAVRAGINGVSHVYGMVTPLVPDTLPPPSLPPTTPEGRRARQQYNLGAWRRVDQADLRRLIDTMVARHVWFEPTLTVEYFTYNGDQYDSASLARYYPWERAFTGWPPDVKVAANERLAAAAKFVRDFHKAGGLVIAGTDELPFPPLGVTEELRLLVQLAGFSPLDALQAATVNAAAALRLDRVGSIQQGYAADLVLLDANPLEDITNTRKIRAVVANGRVYDRAELDAILARRGVAGRN